VAGDARICRAAARPIHAAAAQELAMSSLPQSSSAPPQAGPVAHRPHNTHAAHDPRIEPAEWALRVQLAGTYRVFAMLGWTELIYNHITVRVPGPARHFLINPFGLHYTEVTASNLLKIDLDGNIVGPAEHAVNPAGFVVHSALHRALADAHCIMHTHTTAGMAVACSEAGLDTNNFYAAQLYDKVAYHDFEGITLHADEGPRLVADLGERRLLILRNHGLLSIGSTIAQAFALLWTLNRACEIQLATAALGRPRLIAESVARQASRDSLQFDAAYGAGSDVLDALLRQVERADPSFKV
jgi:ribulose-5-phosphate 4-epimerase/fuculose-1-phosphate aldolase